MTKIEKAQYVVQALYNLKELPKKDSVKVKRINARYDKKGIDELFELAQATLKK